MFKLITLKDTIFTLIFFLFSNLLISQVDNKKEKFVQISSQIEKLLIYDEVSPKDLKSLLIELKIVSNGLESEFNQLKIRVDGHILDYDLKLVRSDVHNQKFDIALKKIPELKLYYPFSTKISSLEKFVDKKTFQHYKKTVKRKRSSYLSIEPSFSGFIPEDKLSNFDKFNISNTNINTVYGLGVYYKINPIEKSKFSKKIKFKYSQIGMKFDYFDAKSNLYFDSLNLSSLSQLSYSNIQISFIARKCIGLDLGFINSNKINLIQRPSSVFNTTISFYIPFNLISNGLNARFLSDFKVYNRIQYGLTFKANIDLWKPFKKSDKEEIKTNIIKIKEL